MVGPITKTAAAILTGLAILPGCSNNEEPKGVAHEVKQDKAKVKLEESDLKESFHLKKEKSTGKIFIEETSNEKNRLLEKLKTLEPYDSSMLEMWVSKFNEKAKVQNQVRIAIDELKASPYIKSNTDLNNNIFVPQVMYHSSPFLPAFDDVEEGRAKLLLIPVTATLEARYILPVAVTLPENISLVAESIKRVAFLDNVNPYVQKISPGISFQLKNEGSKKTNLAEAIHVVVPERNLPAILGTKQGLYMIGSDKLKLLED